MTKNEYLESQRGKTHTQIIAEQLMETVVGSIRGDNLRDVVAILAAGLQYRLDTMQLPAEAEPLRTALLTAFRYLSLPEYGINLALPENVGLLSQAVAVGLVEQTEADKFFQLASYQRPLLNVTRQDCAEYFGPDWVEIEATDARTFAIRLTQAAPEQTHIVIQMQDQYGDGSTSDWYHATALHGLTAAREWAASIPHNGYPRKLRWKCEYQLSGTVAVR